METGNFESENTTVPALLKARNVLLMGAFYVDTLGFSRISAGDNFEIIGFHNRPALTIIASPEVKKSFITIILPDRRELAKVIGRLCTVKHKNLQLENASKQFTTLNDPEGNMIEFCVEKNHLDQFEEKPLDIESLFNELLPDDRLCDKIPANAKIVSAEV